MRCDEMFARVAIISSYVSFEFFGWVYSLFSYWVYGCARLGLRVGVLESKLITGKK